MANFKHKLNPFTGKLQKVLDDSSLSTVENLEDLNDVEFLSGTPTDGQILTYDNASGTWQAKGPSEGGVSNLSELDDVEFESGTPTDCQTLIYDSVSGKWKTKDAIGLSRVIITVGTSGADYDNFDDAIDYLRILNGGKIIVITDMTITSTAIKDISHIEFEGDLFYSGTRKISKTVNGGYWYGKDVIFKNIWFYRLFDTGANEIFRYTENYQDVTLNYTSCIGLGAPTNSPSVFNCNGKEAHLISRGVTLIGAEELGWIAFSNPATLVLHLFDRAGVYLASETIDACFLTSSCIISGTPTFTTPDNPVLIERASGTKNDSSVTGDTVKDALNNLTEKNGINGTFTTTDGKTITVVDGQITAIT